MGRETKQQGRVISRRHIHTKVHAPLTGICTQEHKPLIAFYRDTHARSTGALGSRIFQRRRPERSRKIILSSPGGVLPLNHAVVWFPLPLCSAHSKILCQSISSSPFHVTRSKPSYSPSPSLSPLLHNRLTHASISFVPFTSLSSFFSQVVLRSLTYITPPSHAMHPSFTHSFHFTQFNISYSILSLLLFPYPPPRRSH